MTLEATLIIPWTVIIILATIFYLFYLYNCCVVRQDGYIAALRASQQSIENESELVEYTSSQAVKLLENQLYEYVQNVEVSISWPEIRLDITGGMDMYINGLGILKNTEESRSTSVAVRKSDPVRELRLRH